MFKRVFGTLLDICDGAMMLLSLQKSSLEDIFNSLMPGRNRKVTHT